MSALDEIRTAEGGNRGKCHYCDESSTATIEVRVRERVGQKKQVTSKTVSACDPHAVAVFKDLLKQVERKR